MSWHGILSTLQVPHEYYCCHTSSLTYFPTVAIIDQNSRVKFVAVDGICVMAWNICSQTPVRDVQSPKWPNSSRDKRDCFIWSYFHNYHHITCLIVQLFLLIADTILIFIEIQLIDFLHWFQVFNTMDQQLCTLLNPHTN